MKMRRKKKRIAPTNPPRNVVSGRHLKAGLKTSIPAVVATEQISAKRRDDSVVGTAVIDNRQNRSDDHA
jgi:hypothetical protein